MRVDELFDLTRTRHTAVFAGCEYAWDALKRLGEYLSDWDWSDCHPPCQAAYHIGEKVVIGEGTVIEPGAMIQGPAIIGRNCQIRHNAYLRGNVVVGDNCVLGNACEFKHALLFDGCQVPHFNYVGDSIFGFKAHLGAGVKISNVKLVPGNVMVSVNEQIHDTGLRKFGALIGDHAEIGCNAVLNPGSLIGRNAVVYPNTNWRGVLPANHIVKNCAPQQVVHRR